MNEFTISAQAQSVEAEHAAEPRDGRPIAPVPNYTLADVCPNCDQAMIRRACKVRCERCGFVWDCSEL